MRDSLWPAILAMLGPTLAAYTPGSQSLPPTPAHRLPPPVMQYAEYQQRRWHEQPSTTQLSQTLGSYGHVVPTSQQQVATGQQVLVQGGALRTWSYQDPLIEQVQVCLGSEGRPFDAQIELWHGPNNIPVRMRIYNENGRLRPFNGVIETPRGPSTVAVRNVGEIAFPFTAKVDPDNVLQPSDECLGMAAPIQGDGSLKTFDFDAYVDSVQLLLRTDGRPLNTRIELLQGPSNSKQVIELYTEDGLDRPFFCILETPGDWNVVKVVNTGDQTFPITAAVVPHCLHGEMEWRAERSRLLRDGYPEEQASVLGQERPWHEQAADAQRGYDENEELSHEGTTRLGYGEGGYDYGGAFPSQQPAGYAAARQRQPAYPRQSYPEQSYAPPAYAPAGSYAPAPREYRPQAGSYERAQPYRQGAAYGQQGDGEYGGYSDDGLYDGRESLLYEEGAARRGAYGPHASDGGYGYEEDGGVYYDWDRRGAGLEAAASSFDADRRTVYGSGGGGREPRRGERRSGFWFAPREPRARRRGGAERRLKELQRLLRRRAISPEEYSAKREEVLAML